MGSARVVQRILDAMVSKFSNKAKSGQKTANNSKGEPVPSETDRGAKSKKKGSLLDTFNGFCDRIFSGSEWREPSWPVRIVARICVVLLCLAIVSGYDFALSAIVPIVNLV